MSGISSIHDFDEIDPFWKDAYPEIATIANKVGQMQCAGYLPVATFVLPGKPADLHAPWHWLR
jgi:hypothetical protein